MRRRKITIFILLVLVVAAIAGGLTWAVHIHRLRAEMEKHFSDAVTHIGQGLNNTALTDAEAALELAQRLRDSETAAEIEAHIQLVETVIRGKTFFDAGDYVAARDAFLQARAYVLRLDTVSHDYISEMLAKTEKFIAFYALIDRAKSLIETSEYNTALFIYEEAKSIASALSFAEGEKLAEVGIADTKERIRIAEKEKEQEQSSQDNSDATYDVIDPNYEHNLSVIFDLRILIDDQNRRPANRIKMGSSEGHNEGWYNGCGWVATYNALVLLGTPEHPADIVRFFETSGGTVLDGVYGTYPFTIEAYLKDLGHSVDHTLFPQLTIDIDDAIKASRVSILAYVHKNAAHYVAIEYRQDIDKFVIYNDSFAQTRSENLGFQNETRIGAAIDSVAALINYTPDILFSFSLIAVS